MDNKEWAAEGSGSSRRGAAAASGASGCPKGVERRRRRRALISAPVRIRAVEVTGAGPDEIATTIDVSRVGILFLSSHPGYLQGMDVKVTFPYSNAPTALQAEQDGRVARVLETPDGRRAVAVALGPTDIGDLVDACGRKLGDSPSPSSDEQRRSIKPMILVLDSDPAIQESLKSYLIDQGYEVIAVNCASDAREVLNLFTPVLVIAEIEGEDMPGYTICSHVKGTPRLNRVPVVLLTSSACPSDYSGAHSLGALVCMAKPYRRERLGHIVRLLAPLPHIKVDAAPQRSPDPSRKSAAAIGRRDGTNRDTTSASKPVSMWRFRL